MTLFLAQYAGTQATMSSADLLLMERIMAASMEASGLHRLFESPGYRDPLRQGSRKRACLESQMTHLRLEASLIHNFSGSQYPTSWYKYKVVCSFSFHAHPGSV